MDWIMILSMISLWPTSMHLTWSLSCTTILSTSFDAGTCLETNLLDLLPTSTTQTPAPIYTICESEVLFDFSVS